MNRARHMSYQYRTRNKKGGNDTVRSRLGLDYMMLLQCLSYKGSKGEGHRNKIHLGWFLYLQGRQAPQASYTWPQRSPPRYDCDVEGNSPKVILLISYMYILLRTYILGCG